MAGEYEQNVRDFFNHPVWKDFVEGLVERLDQIHREIENPKLDLPATNLLRGEIKHIRAVLDSKTWLLTTADKEIEDE